MECHHFLRIIKVLSSSWYSFMDRIFSELRTRSVVFCVIFIIWDVNNSSENCALLYASSGKFAWQWIMIAPKWKSLKTLCELAYRVTQNKCFCPFNVCCSRWSVKFSKIFSAWLKRLAEIIFSFRFRRILKKNHFWRLEFQKSWASSRSPSILWPLESELFVGLIIFRERSIDRAFYFWNFS